ncbi:MAG TPA: MarR family winged helix-turn-helix transcriptional regulator [Actinomycetota bacterium]|jgi:DNA-binding MarR family transcriptional regulator|nr:MarR family winged helix-turn-helix transcriptional regulator [Actinomycetota bacterium]
MSDALLPAERKVLDELGHLPLDFRAMGAISNVFRSSTALRRHLEATVLADDRLSWTAFTGLWVLWIWGEIEAREFAAAVGISRPTATGVLATLHGRRLVRRRRAAADGRVILVSLTPTGRRKIEHLFPRFNDEEARVAAALSGDEQVVLASMLRRILRRVGPPVDVAAADAQAGSRLKTAAST